jgi:hypothetical protein
MEAPMEGNTTAETVALSIITPAPFFHIPLGYVLGVADEEVTFACVRYTMPRRQDKIPANHRRHIGNRASIR